MYRKKRRKSGIRINGNNAAAGARAARRYDCVESRTNRAGIAEQQDSYYRYTDHINENDDCYNNMYENNSNNFYRQVSNNNEKYPQKEYYDWAYNKNSEEVSNNYQKYSENEYNAEGCGNTEYNVSDNNEKYSKYEYYNGESGSRDYRNDFNGNDNIDNNRNVRNGNYGRNVSKNADTADRYGNQGVNSDYKSASYRYANDGSNYGNYRAEYRDNSCYENCQSSGAVYRADSVRGRYSSGKKRQTGRGTRRIFSMAAWTASFIMVINMLPADSPVSKALEKYEESFPAMSLGLEELKNGLDGTGKSENAETQGIDGNSDISEQSNSGNENSGAENSPVSAGSNVESSGAGDSFVKTALIVSDGAMPVNDGNDGSVNETGGNESNSSAVSAVTLNGIKLVLSDSGSKSSAQGSAADISSSQPAATAQENTSSNVQGSASSQANASAVLTNNTATAAKTVNVSNATGSGDIIIYHTHATEAYAPVANAETTHSTNAAGTVREAGDNLSAALTAKGYNVIHDKTLHDSPSYNKSYNRSLETLKKLLSAHKSPKLVIDFHRDAATASGKAKTVKVNNETISSFALVVGTKNDNYKQIRALADKIVKKANEMYPGICTGVIEKPYKFNGYLNNNYILLEFGNNANTINQINAAVPYLADILTNVVK